MEILVFALIAMVLFGTARAIGFLWKMSGQIAKPFSQAASGFVETTGHCIGSFFRGLFGSGQQIEFTDIPATKQERVQVLKQWRDDNQAIVVESSMTDTEKRQAKRYVDEQFAQRLKELLDE